MNNLWFEPHKPVEAEKFFTDFIHNFGGEKISDRLSTSPSFENADFYFPESKVVAELKCLETDFPKLKSYQDKWIELQKKWISEKKVSLSMILGNDPLPDQLRREYIEIFRYCHFES